jgi:hypothetical protein
VRNSTHVKSAARGVAGLVLFLNIAIASHLSAEPRERPRLQTADSSGTSVYLVTVGPGEQVWERFGHNAIWISNESEGFNRAYNYGLFSFEQEGFVRRFLQGRMQYWMRGFDTDSHLRGYVSHNRSVWIQELNLTDSQKVALRDFLAWNELPENRFYRYHYYHDNCSTRIRDAIDRVIGGAIREQTESEFPGTTLRYHSLRLVSGDLLAYIGLSLGLGEPVDEPLSAWDEMFLPLKLRDHLREVVVPDVNGNSIPLVASETTMYESTEFVEREAPPHWIKWFLAAGVLLALTALIVAHKATDNRAARMVFAGFSMLWYTLTGLIGLGLAGLWLFTDHDTSYRNENLFCFDPVAIVLVVLVPLLICRVPWADRLGRLIAIFVAGVSVLGFFLQVLPGVDQVNGTLIAFALPPNLAFAAGLLWYSSIENGGTAVRR